MTEIRALIEQLVAAGVDPIEAAEVVSRAAIHGAANSPPARTARQERNARYYAAKASEKRLKSTEQDVLDGGEPSLVPLQVSPQTPLPKTLNPIPPSAPKGASSPAETEIAFDAWDQMAARTGLAKVRVRSKARVTGLAGVIRQHGLPVLLEAIGRVEASAFCRGENERGWRADLDFLLQPKSFGRLLEGHFDNRSGQSRASPAQSGNAAAILKSNREQGIFRHDGPAPTGPRLIAAR